MTTDVLYDDGRVRISYLNESIHDEHSLFIGKGSFILQRGILEELAKTKPSELKPKLRAIDDMIEFSMGEHGLSHNDMGYALAQERIRDLEIQLLESFPYDDSQSF